MITTNTAAERAVLAGICKYGSDVYFDVCDLIRESSFTVDSNQIIYKCIHSVLENDSGAVIDLPTILAAANSLGLGFVFHKATETQHLQSIFDFPVDIKNVRRFAGIISKLEVGRLLEGQLTLAKHNLSEITGEEKLSHILGIAENVIFDFSSLINEKVDSKRLGDGLQELLKHLEDNPVDSVGVPTGYKLVDKYIGGGLRTGVTVITARLKQGKSYFGDNVGVYIAEHSCPVLNIDTEMLIKDHQIRTTALLSKVPSEDIETGKFKFNALHKANVYKASDKLAKLPYYHQCISGMPFEEQLSVMRRWLLKEVGLNSDGTAKKCVIIYDYLKLMESSSISNNIAEYQAIGFMMTALHNFANRYNVPILAFVQANRDGITKDSTDIIAQSDRVGWLCIAALKWASKSDDEIGMWPTGGNRKMVVLASRYGEGMQSNDYIDFKFEGWCGKITEGQLSSSHRDDNQTGFECDLGDDIIELE